MFKIILNSLFILTTLIALSSSANAGVDTESLAQYVKSIQK